MNDAYERAYSSLLSQPVYGCPQVQKESSLLRVCNILHDIHSKGCGAYRQIASTFEKPYYHLVDLPYVSVRQFKLDVLFSIKQDAVFRTLTSSGTTGQVPAKIILDKETSARQSKALVLIMQQYLGKSRLPMLIIDSPSVLRNPSLSARAAGIQGMAFFGRDHTYALDDKMQLNTEAVMLFAEKYAGQPTLIFGFTFMVWLNFVEVLQQSGLTLNLNQATLIHSGGWKKLVDRQVDNDTFKSTLADRCGIQNVHNFYGMAEQVGSVFVECERGVLHAPSLADVIIRDPFSLAPLSIGEPGLIQVISALPTSYPGYSILTEDLGRLLGTDSCPCGRQGNYFEVLGRLPKTEIRGCSDTQGTQP